MRYSGFEHILKDRAVNSGDRPALIYEAHGKKSLTYTELKSAVDKKAIEFHESGKTCIGILSDGSVECVISIFAAVQAGLQVVMLDENAPVPMLQALLRYTDIDTLWGDEDLCSELVPFLTGGVRCGGSRILFFTSGTTEQAKAVVLTESSLCASAWNGGEKLPLRETDTLLCMLPLGHVFGFVCGLLWGLTCGAAVALGRGARHYGDDCMLFRPTALSAVPTLLGFLLKHDLLNEELRLILVGAGDCPGELLAQAASKGVHVSFGYGLTETSSGVAISVSGDPFAMEICPDDSISLAEDGEILISAPTCMMQGYYKKEADTKAVLKDGVLHTGDLGRFDGDGRLHITGRKKDILVLSDGTKIFLPEYEGRISAVLGSRELAVFLENGIPALILQADPASEKELRKTLAPLMADLPRGQQLSRIYFTDTPMPRTANGKLKRWEINTGGNIQ